MINSQEDIDKFVYTLTGARLLNYNQYYNCNVFEPNGMHIHTSDNITVIHYEPDRGGYVCMH